jgi:hypothetical protein
MLRCVPASPITSSSNRTSRSRRLVTSRLARSARLEHDERVAGEHLAPHHGAARLGMLVMQYGDDLHGVDHSRANRSAVWHSCPADREVDVALVQRRERVALVLANQAQLDLGISRRKVAESGENALRHVDLDDDAEDRCSARGRRSCRVSAARSGLHRDASLAEQRLPGRAQLDPARVPFEELNPELGLQAADLLRERRLRDVEPVRGATEVQFLGHGHERGQQAKVEPHCGECRRRCTGCNVQRESDLGHSRDEPARWRPRPVK